MAFVLGAMFGAVWLTSCGGANYFGGATLGRRFLLAVIPLLLPAAAVTVGLIVIITLGWQIAVRM